jgi:hypothetical protein
MGGEACAGFAALFDAGGLAAGLADIGAGCCWPDTTMVMVRNNIATRQEPRIDKVLL